MALKVLIWRMLKITYIAPSEREGIDSKLLKVEIARDSGKIQKRK